MDGIKGYISIREVSCYWAREAERMRDEALAGEEMARDKAAHEQIVRKLTEELNRA